MKFILRGTFAAVMGLSCVCVQAAAAANGLADLSLEELSDVEITSVSRRPERLGDAAASIYVITREAIHRSGTTTLPEALRLAPNLQVAQIDASQYAISTRGFNNAIGNKLLVLVDGRTVYTPFFSGVFWDQQDVMLEDVERIEVISGPGATLWGANAVNGVINVITRPAKDTRGALGSVNAGNTERGATARFGGALGEVGQYRVYGKTIKLDNTRTASGAPVLDEFERHQIGFRSDWQLAAGDLTVQGDAYTGGTESRMLFNVLPMPPLEVAGHNLLARFTRRLGGGSNFHVQLYYDHTERDDAVLYRPNVDVYDAEFQHEILLESHKLVWGAGYRHAHDQIGAGLFFGFEPESRATSWSNIFVQDEIALARTVALTLGLKLERNDFTGTEKLPSLRLAWRLSEQRLLWGAFSRAVRAPARLDRDIRLPPTPPYSIAGGPDFVSEVANVYELGWRAQPRPDVNYSLTAFLHDWDRLRSGQTPPNAQVQNMIEGETYGLEGWLNWQVSTNWRLSAGGTTLKKDLRLKPGSTDPDGPKNLGNDPATQWQLRSSLALPHQQLVELALRRVGALPDPYVPDYVAFDARWAWQASERLEFSISGRNLFDDSHPEFSAATGTSEIGRSVMVQLRLSL